MPILFNNVGFEWPNGKIIFNRVHLSLESKIYGLVGPNGVGKTTLAKLLLQQLQPTTGSVDISRESLFYFLQMEAPQEISIAEYLVDAIASGDPLVFQFTKNFSLEQSCLSLSGGEWTRVRLAKVAGSGATFIVLDEPTNHLDQQGKQAVREFIESFQGGVLIISHDREVLELTDKIIELTPGRVSIYGGNWSDYYRERIQERERLRANLQNAEKQRDTVQEQRQRKLQDQVKRQHQGKLKGLKGGMPKILLGARKRNAQVTFGKIDHNTMDDVNSAVENTLEAYKKLKVDPVMYARLPEVQIPEGKLIFAAKDFNFRFQGGVTNLLKNNLTFSFKGAARVAIQGINGSGKSTLLKLLRKENLDIELDGYLEMGSVRAAFLDQNYSMLNSDLSVLENIQETANLETSQLRSLLAMFLFENDKVHQKVSELSGGERLRASLAKVLLANPPANALFLDEPTNNLDFPNIEFLESLLAQYQGALVVISHDKTFLNNIDIQDTIYL